MAPLAAYDRFDVAICGMIALFVLMALYWTNRRPSDFEDEPILSRAEKLMIWAIVAMFSAMFIVVMMRR